MRFYRMRRLRVAPILILCFLALGLTHERAAAEDCIDTAVLTDRQISRCDYADRLRAMWLAETIANWTELTTEAAIQDAPFYIDVDWERDQHLNWKANDTIDFVYQDPWLSDDTDIEYLYLDLMLQHDTAWLAPEWIAEGWVTHVNDAIWGGNGARNLLEWGVLPPVSGMSAVYPYPLLTDAQFITEIFGALAPGMPDYALWLGDLPIRVTSDGYGAHAAQFYILEDTFTGMAEHMLPFVEQVIVEAGGSVDGDVWTLPPAPSADPLRQNPLEQIHRRSANNTVLLAGGTIQASDGEASNSRTSVIADGRELNFSGEESRRPPRAYRARAQDSIVTLSITYDRDVEVKAIRLIEGDAGGHSDVAAEVLVGSAWQPVPDATLVTPSPDPNQPYQMIDFVLPEAIQARGFRVTGSVGGVFGDVSVLELDALSEADSSLPAGSELAAH